MINGIFFNQGHVCCAGSRLLVQEPVFDLLLAKLKDRLQTPQGRRPARQEHRRRRDQLEGPAREDRGARRSPASRKARRSTSRRATCPSAASGSGPRCSRASRNPTASRARRSSDRCCRSSRSARPRRRSRRRTTRPTGCRAGIWTEKGSRILHMAQRLRAGVVWANTFNRFDPTSPFGGYKESGFGTGRRPARPRALPLVRRGPRAMTSDDRLEVRRTAKLYIGGAFPRSESGRSYEVTAHDGKPLAQVSRASRKDLREAVVAARARVPGVVGRDRLPARPDPVPRGRDDGGPPLPVRGRARRCRRRRPGRAASSASIDRWVWYAGWADKLAQVIGATNPVAGPYFNFTLPEPTGVVGIVAPGDQSLLGLVSRLAPAIVSGNTSGRDRERALAAVRRSRSPRCSPRATCPAGW